jgi:hypothetical protein
MKNLGSATALCAALVLLCGSVLAESPGHSPSNGSAPQSETRASHAPATVPAGQAALETARAQVSWMSLRSDHIFRWLRVARGQGNARRSRCLDGKLSEAHAVERQGRNELKAIQRSAKLGSDRFGPSLTRLRRFATRSNQLMASAHRCGQKVSRRRRLPTEYRVRMVAPPLPAAHQEAKRRPKATSRRRTAASQR